MANPTTPSPGPNYRWNGDTWEWVPPDQRQPTTAPTTSPTDTSQYNPRTATPTPGQIQQAAAPALAGTLPLSATGLTPAQLIQARDMPPPSSAPSTPDASTGSSAASGPFDYTNAATVAAKAGAAPSGYDPSKWGNADYWSHPKYKAGEIYQAAVANGLTPDQAVDQIVAAFPGAKRLSGDRVDFGTQNGEDIGVVDVVRDYGQGGANGVAWGTPDAPSSGAAGLQGGVTTPGGFDSTFQRLMSGDLASLFAGDQGSNAADRQALIQTLSNTPAAQVPTPGSMSTGNTTQNGYSLSLNGASPDVLAALAALNNGSTPDAAALQALLASTLKG